jgi:hypothetical protein
VPEHLGQRRDVALGKRGALPALGELPAIHAGLERREVVAQALELVDRAHLAVATLERLLHGIAQLGELAPAGARGQPAQLGDAARAEAEEQSVQVADDVVIDPQPEHEPDDERRAGDAGEPAVHGGIRRREARGGEEPERPRRGDESAGEAGEPQPQLEARADTGTWLGGGKGLGGAHRGEEGVARRG